MILRGNNYRDRMSALGQKQTLRRVCVMSALPPKADIRYGDRHVRFVPQADVGRLTRSSHQQGLNRWVRQRDILTLLIEVFKVCVAAPAASLRWPQCDAPRRG